ncbi:Signal transducer regulating beta-lactamase production, contains metallopeptidase domain [Butyrivibrio sp. ob235]|uniref:M56 family metallopeptidase n=1 Tax=Butyrivibrio sp. ob235 TaxID=1761780 RepID=UPI0008B4A13E|nr:M56 family metallopeptidase [Butyrivibrio sp. ob235]SEL14501.1 Signal transducer regulating beta-lactamase production, contains metallopeptidase domain [Butyrivibrio sp. ob235]
MSIINLWSILNAAIVGTFWGLIFRLALSKQKISYEEGITPYLIVLLLIVLRSILPLDFAYRFIIPSKIVLYELDVFLQSPIIGGFNLINIIALTWIIGSAIAVVRWVNNLRRVKNTISCIKQSSRVLPEEYRDLAQNIGLVPERIMLSKYIDMAVTVGAFDYYVIIPDMNYTDSDMRNILRHEADHIHHGDIFIKMLIHIACCLLWWNPFLLLLEKDFSLLIEYRCDDNAVREYSDIEKISYVETIKKMAAYKFNYPCECNAVGFAIASEKSTLVSRAKRVLFNQNKKRRWSTLLICPLAIAIFLVSFTVQAQPSGDPGYIEGEIIITKDNAYLQLTPDGYDLYVDGELFEQHIPKKELKVEPYNMLEIRK